MRPTSNAADADTIGAVAMLGDDVRRRLYMYARAARRPVSRDEAAHAAGISRKLAAFHLDKLVDAGLLRPSEAVGVRRVGRPRKAYEPTDDVVQISIPARRHEVLADILAQAVLDEDAHGSARSAAVAAAYERGFAAAAQARELTRSGRIVEQRALARAQGILSEYGFEPDVCDDRSIRLRNCPFHPLAQKAPELVCRLNLAFAQGLIAGLQASTVDAVLAPAAGECCVELRRAT